MERITDEELMKLVLEGNLDLMHHLFRRYHVKIYNFCLQMTKDRELSKDLTQDVFYKVLKYRTTYKHSKFSSWIYAIARNLCRDHYKVLNKAQQLNEDYIQVDHSIRSSESEPLGNINQLNLALNKLNHSDRELIVMGKFQGIKYQEIADITNSTLGAVKTKMHRAMQKLKDAYFLKDKAP